LAVLQDEARRSGGEREQTTIQQPFGRSDDGRWYRHKAPLVLVQRRRYLGNLSL
jgi:hypothetical protein